MSIINKAYIRMTCAKHMMKENFKEKFLENERGAMGVIEIIIIIAVVLVIGALFWDKITEFVGGLMDSVFGEGGSGDSVQGKINEGVTSKSK